MLSIFAFFAALALGILFSYLFTYLNSPLRHFDGPFWAKFTDWWRLLHTAKLKTHEVQLQLHKKYGSAVRYGPNCISLRDPTLNKTIYNIKGDFVKSNFYCVNAVVQDGQIIENIFSTRSNADHKQWIRPIQKIYTMNNILTLEPLADKTIATFCRRLEEEFIGGQNGNRVCDLGAWLLFYAWDVVGEVTLDEPIGFLEKGDDIDGLLHTAEKALKYFAVVGQMPQLDKLLAKNPYYRIGPPSFERAGQFCATRMGLRLQSEKRSNKDLLNKFLNLQEEFPGAVTLNEVMGYMLINILAGADTTSITLRAIIYYLLKNPRALFKLHAELDATKLQMPVSYGAVKSLPYLDAVIKESTRLHPGVGMLLERIVPERGLTLPDGRFIPAGTIVGMNPWVVQRDKEVYGEDAADFRPERWLKYDDETEEEYKGRAKRMKDGDLTFGAGNRVCIGKNLALMEVYKVIPTLLSKYNFELADPSAEWNVKNAWFTLQENINVRIKHR